MSVTQVHFTKHSNNVPLIHEISKKYEKSSDTFSLPKNFSHKITSFLKNMILYDEKVVIKDIPYSEYKADIILRNFRYGLPIREYKNIHSFIEQVYRHEMISTHSLIDVQTFVQDPYMSDEYFNNFHEIIQQLNHFVSEPLM